MNEIYNEWLKERGNYKKLKDWNPHLPELIIKNYPTSDNKMMGHVNRIITGPPGLGKSIYAYKIGAKTHYLFNGYTKVDEEEYSYKYSLDQLMYRPQQLFDKIRVQRQRNEPELFGCIDDGSVHMGRQLFDQDRETYRKLQGIVPTLREDFTGFLVTTVILNMLAKPLREFVRHKVIIKPMAELKSMRRLAVHYERWYFPDDIRFRMLVPFQEKFSSLCPEPFYSWYHEKKMKALNEYMADLERKPVKPSGGEDVEEDSGT